MVRQKRIFAILLVVLPLLLTACSSEPEGPPPCIPMDGSQNDPCDGDLSIVPAMFQTRSNIRASVWIGDEPRSILSYLTGNDGAVYEGHIVVRGQFISNTMRCTEHTGYRPQPYLSTAIWRTWVVKCYGDLRVMEYIVGSGPETLTTVIGEVRGATPDDPEAERASIERMLVAGDLAGSEAIMFLGPSLETSTESWQVLRLWDLERQEDGTVIAVHPYRDYWQRQENYESTHRAKVEMSLADFRREAQAAHTTRIAEYAGRIDEGTDRPHVVTNANNLNAFNIETGAANRANPPGQPPPACGRAISDSRNNAGLILDCMALLEAKDTLRGTGTLNWDVGTAIGSWDGVTVGGTPQRVTKLELANKSLTGSVPAALAKLELTTLKLTGNSLAGCIPVALREVAVNDLDDLGLPDCAG